jgi:hypothetical protein
VKEKVEHQVQGLKLSPTGMKEEIKEEPDCAYTAVYSVIFREECGQVKDEITEEQGEDQPANGGEDQPINRGEDQPTNGGEDLNVVEMKKEEEENDNFQVTTQAFRFIILRKNI